MIKVCIHNHSSVRYFNVDPGQSFDFHSPLIRIGSSAGIGGAEVRSPPSGSGS